MISQTLMLWVQLLPIIIVMLSTSSITLAESGMTLVSKGFILRHTVMSFNPLVHSHEYSPISLCNKLAVQS